MRSLILRLLDRLAVRSCRACLSRPETPPLHQETSKPTQNIIKTTKRYKKQLKHLQTSQSHGRYSPDTMPLVCLGALNAEMASEALREVSVTSFSISAASYRLFQVAFQSLKRLRRGHLGIKSHGPRRKPRLFRMRFKLERLSGPL